MNIIFSQLLFRPVLWAHCRPSIQRATADTESSSERNAPRSLYEQAALRVVAGFQMMGLGAASSRGPMCFPVPMAYGCRLKGMNG